ncbi:MAG: hypothetical protein II939_13110 [Bacteroidales bacterium]|nr:hypothetical protein [Bacteroidales bacterium]
MKTTIHTTMKTIMKLAAVMLILCINSGVYAQTSEPKTFYVRPGGGDWNNLSTWSYSDESPSDVDALPTERDVVYIKSNVTIQGSTVAKAAVVHLETQSSITITNDAAIPQFGAFEGGGQLTLHGDNYPQVADGGDTYTGNVTFTGNNINLERNIQNYKNLKINIGIGSVNAKNANLTFGELRVPYGTFTAENNIAVLGEFVINENAKFVGNNGVTISTYGNITNSG